MRGAHYLPVDAETGGELRMAFRKARTGQLETGPAGPRLLPGQPKGRDANVEGADLFETADRPGFVIASEECYSEISPDPARRRSRAAEGGHRAGRAMDSSGLMVFGSMFQADKPPPSIRHVAGDARMIAPFLRYGPTTAAR